MAKKVWILTELMRASKSGYFIEGTDIMMDFPDFYPIPLETEVLEEGRPMALRVLPHCKFLEKEKQIKAGYPEVYRWTDSDRRRLTFTFARLELDEARDGIFIEYFERTAWVEGNEEKKPRAETKTIAMRYDEDAIIDSEIDDEEAITKAKALVFGMDFSTIRNVYRLANPSARANDGLTSLGKMKKNLLDIASVNPEFIINGVKSSRDTLIVLVSRAIEQNVVSLEFPGMVALFNAADNEFQPLITATDEYGPDAKFDKLVEYLQTEQGTVDLAVIQKRLNDTPELEEAEAAPPVKSSKPKAKRS